MGEIVECSSLGIDVSATLNSEADHAAATATDIGLETF